MKYSILIFILITLTSFNCRSQVQPEPVFCVSPKVKMDSIHSYIYCASTDLLWNEVCKYIGESPKTTKKNSTFDLLNKAVGQNYKSPLESPYVVAKCGKNQDSIFQKINSELSTKFNSTWDDAPLLGENDLLAFAQLQKKIQFKFPLSQTHSSIKFNNINYVQYFGTKLGDPNGFYKNLVIHDFKNVDNFILQLKCKDSLDEVYLAKIPKNTTLYKTYFDAIYRVHLNKTTLANGNDLINIPYIQFDTTFHYQEMENCSLTNSPDPLTINSFYQGITFDMDEDGIELSSRAVALLEFADYENNPRLLAFDQPFLIILKRKNSNQPYFLYWVSGTEFMRIVENRKSN